MFGMFKRYRNRFRHEFYNSKFDLEQVYETKQGVKFYTYKSPIQLPYKRIEQALIFSRYAQLCITPERLQDYLKGIKAAINKNDLTRAGGLVEHLMITDEVFGERQTLLNLACVYTVIEGEPAEQFSEHFQQKKKAIFDHDEDCRDFFLAWAYQKVPNFTKASKQSILNNLATMQPAQKLFHSMQKAT